jgi:hypothetical protein
MRLRDQNVDECLGPGEGGSLKSWGNIPELALSAKSVPVDLEIISSSSTR